MTKGEKESKITVQPNANKGINTIMQNRSLNLRRKEECGLLQHRMKTNLKQNRKQKNVIRFQKTSKKVTISNKLLKNNEEMCKHQIPKLNQILQKSLKCSTLTQDELKMLFVKYKLDGHYRTNKNLPPFTSLLNSSNNIVGKNNFYDETQHTPIPDIQRKDCTTNKDAHTNLYYNPGNESQHTEANLNTYRNTQQTLKYEAWKPKTIFWESNVDNRNGNKYLYEEENHVVDRNCNHMLTNYNIQTCSNKSVFTDVQNFDQSELKLNVNEISDMQEEYFSCDLMNPQNIFLEEHQSLRYTNKNLLFNVSDPSVQYGNFKSSSENPQQNDAHCAAQYNDLSLNSNFSNDFHFKQGDTNTLSKNQSNNFKSWKSEHSICTPQTNNMKFYYNMNNHSEEQSIFDSNVHKNVYPIVDNKNLAYVTNNGSINVQQDSNTYTSNSIVMSDNFLPEANTVLSPYTVIG